MTEVMVDSHKCHHCGDPCDESPIRAGDHSFCCYGCKAVSELLENSTLKPHYQETSKKNKSISNLKAERKYAFLDHPDIQRQLLRFQDDTLSVMRFSLPGIHCSSCIYLLEHLPRIDSSIVRAEVHFVRREVTVSFKHTERSLREIAVLLSQLGYPPDLSLDSLDQTKKHLRKSDLGLKIAVAGFCFGNAMLMSMPEYLDRNLELTEDFKSLFGWINLALALPVVLFSAKDYFQKAWRGLVAGTVNIDLPIALGILTLFGRSAYEIISGKGMGYVDSLAGLLFFLLIGKWYQGKTYQALSFERDYASYFPVSVTCIIDGQPFTRSLKELQKGDVVVIHHDELIPADGRIVQGNGHIDYSFVTGEADPVGKQAGDVVYAGGRQKGGELVMRLEKKVDNSELTSLWNSEGGATERSALHSWVDRISKYFTLAILFIALATASYWWMMDATKIWNAVTAVLIVACPCALALVLPFAYGHAMRMYGRKGLYLKNAEVVESLSAVDTIVFDKTGTLTQNKAGVEYTGEALTIREKCLLKSALGNSAHPLSRVLHAALPDCEKLPVQSFAEETGQGFSTEIEGMLLQVGSARYVGAPEIKRNNQTQVHVSIGAYKGYFTLSAEYREGIFDTLTHLGASYDLHLLSGDNDAERGRLKPFFHQAAFNQRPADKRDYLDRLETKTLMVGDGLNDAGALKHATVGIAVADDIHQFSPACDAIIQSGKINSMPSMLTFSKKIIRVVFIAFGLSFLYNIVGLSFAVSGHLTPLISAILMPISSVTVVGFVTFMAWRLGSRMK